MSGERGAFDPERFADRIAKASERRDELILAELQALSANFGAMHTTVESVRAEVRRQGFSLGTVESRFAELEIQIGESRDLANKTRQEIANHIATEAEAAAKGAAQGAIEGMGTSTARIGPVIREAVAKSTGKTSKPVWVAVAIVAFMGAADFVEKAPAVFRAVAAFFTGVTELDK